MISIIIPTHNRRAYLEKTLPSYLSQPEVLEIIVVDDGSIDGTHEWVTQQAKQDTRIKLVRHETRKGAPAARNTGIAAATCDWILFGEDDLLFSPEYASGLLAAASAVGADIVAGTLVYLRPNEDPADARLRWGTGKATRSRWLERLTIQYDFGPGWIEPTPTPFLHACSLIRRSVLSRCSYDPGYGGNGYREETSFYLSAEEDGFRLYYVPGVYCYHLAVNRKEKGGQWTMSRLSYERWAWRNNWRFLRRHAKYLRAVHGIRTPIFIMQTAFVAERIYRLIEGRLKKWRS